MKTVVFKYVICCLAILSFACSNDYDQSLRNIYSSYGTIVEGEDSDITIIQDDGRRLIVETNRVSYNYDYSPGKRVWITYNSLGSTTYEDRQTYGIRLLSIYDILTKEPVPQSFILENEEHRTDSIGNDPIRSRNISLSSQYLTMEFNVFVKYPNTEPHLINLVHDDIRSNMDTAYLYFRHNAYGNIPQSGYIGNYDEQIGVASFDITGIVPEGEESVVIKLHWTEFGNTAEVINERWTTARYEKPEELLYISQPQNSTSNSLNGTFLK